MSKIINLFKRFLTLLILVIININCIFTFWLITLFLTYDTQLIFIHWQYNIILLIILLILLFFALIFSFIINFCFYLRYLKRCLNKKIRREKYENKISRIKTE